MITLASSPASAESGLGGPITRDEIIARAQYWIQNPPGPYSSQTYVKGIKNPGVSPTVGYRLDCSGLVSMALHLGSNPPTSTLPQFGDKIDPSDLRPGDYVNSPVRTNNMNHVMLFDQWADKSRGLMWVYDFSYAPRNVSRRQMTPQWAGNGGTYMAFRYKNVIESNGNPAAPEAGPALSYDAPATLVDSANRISLYAIRSDGNVWGATQPTPGAGLGAWTTIGEGGGSLVGRPSVIQLSNGIIAIYARSQGGTVVGTSQAYVGGPFGAWTTIGTAGAGVTGDPVAVQLASGVIAVYATTQAGTVSGASQSVPGGVFGSWSTIGAPGAALIGRPAVVRFSDDRIGVYAEGADGYVYGGDQVARGSGFRAFARLGTNGAGITTEPVAVLDRDKVTVFAGAGSTVASVTQPSTGAAFGSWVNLGWGGTGIASATPAVIPSPGAYSAYARGDDGTVWGTTVSTSPSPAAWGQIGSGMTIATSVTGLRTSTGINCVYGANIAGAIAGSCQTSPDGPFSAWVTLF